MHGEMWLSGKYMVVKMGDMMVTKCGDVVAKEGRCRG